jgi:hypothetical protein
MKHWKLTRWMLAASLGFHASTALVSAQQVPPNSPQQDADILQMLKEDLAANEGTLSREDAEHIRRLQRLHELRTETIMTEPAGAAVAANPLEAAEIEEHVWELDAEVQQIWRELAELRRSINGGNVDSPAVRNRPGIDEPIPFDPELEGSPETDNR